MSRDRISPKAGWAHGKLPRGPNGRVLCRECGQETAPPRRTFCSDRCVDRWKIKTDPGYARDMVAKRDKGICASCGLDTKRLDRLWRWVRRRHWPKKNDRTMGELDNGGFSKTNDWVARYIMEKLAIKPRSTVLMYNIPDHFWEADHRKPVALGGGECGLRNYRTLCLSCHRKVTATLRAKLAKLRAAEKRKLKETPDVS